jgi:predicted aspartyl protease
MKTGLIAASWVLSTQCVAAVIVPIEIESGNPVAAARINDVPVRLVIDSGGGVLTLKSETVNRIGLAPTGATRPTTDALGNNASRDLFRVKTLELGALKLTDLDADEATEYASQSPVDGVIGRFVLNKFAVVYDYPARRIMLIPPDNKNELRTECRGTKVDLTASAEELIVSQAQIDHGDIRMLWDTGAVYSFVKQSFADQHELPIEKPYYTSQRFGLAKEEFGPMRFVALDLRAPAEADGYIGTNFFLDHVVCIDPTHRVVKVRKNS